MQTSQAVSRSNPVYAAYTHTYIHLLCMNVGMELFMWMPVERVENCWSRWGQCLSEESNKTEGRKNYTSLLPTRVPPTGHSLLPFAQGHSTGSPPFRLPSWKNDENIWLNDFKHTWMQIYIYIYIYIYIRWPVNRLSSCCTSGQSLYRYYCLEGSEWFWLEFHWYLWFFGNLDG